MTPGTSALFAMTADPTVDRMVEELNDYEPKVVSTSFSREQEDRLRAAFAK